MTYGEISREMITTWGIVKASKELKDKERRQEMDMRAPVEEEEMSQPKSEGEQHG